MLATGTVTRNNVNELYPQFEMLYNNSVNMINYCFDRFPRKTKQVLRMIRSIPGKVTVGCTTISAVSIYERLFRELFADRPLFVIRGDVTFRCREKIIAEFEATENGLLVCTQQSLKSSANIPSCNHAILESLQWNISKMAGHPIIFQCKDETGFPLKSAFAFLVDNDNRTVSVFKILNESLYCSLLPIQCIRNFRFIRRAVRLNNKNSNQIVRCMSSRFVKVNLLKSHTVTEKRTFICCNDIADREGMPAVQTMAFCIQSPSLLGNSEICAVMHTPFNTIPQFDKRGEDGFKCPACVMRKQTGDIMCGK